MGDLMLGSPSDGPGKRARGIRMMSAPSASIDVVMPEPPAAGMVSLTSLAVRFFLADSSNAISRSLTR